MKLLIIGSTLLLCGLLSTSHSTGGKSFSSVVQWDMDALQNEVGNALEKENLLEGLVGRLLGGSSSSSGGSQGGLLGGLLGGKTGLLGNVLGDVLSLEITEAELLGVTLNVISPTALVAGIDLNVGLKANVIGSNLVDVKVKVHIAGNTEMVVKEEGGLVFVPHSCEVSTQIQTKLLPALEGTVSSLLNKVLPNLLCPIGKLIASLLTKILDDINSLVPLDGLGTVQYALADTPVAADDKILLGLNLGLLGSPGQSFQFPQLDASSLPLLQPGDHTSRLIFPKEILSSLLKLHLSEGNLNLNIREGVSGALDISVLRSVLPLGTLPADVPLEARVQLKDVQVVSMDNGQAVINLDATVDVFAQTSSGPRSLLTLDVTSRLTGTVVVTGTALSISLDVDEQTSKTGGGERNGGLSCTSEEGFQSVSVKVSSSAIGAIDNHVLENWATNLIDVGIVSRLNELLKAALPLPAIGSLTPVSGPVSTVGETVAINLISA